MPLTAAQTTAFFEGQDQMAIPHETVVQLENEGIEAVGDLEDFDETTLKQIADNLRRPGGRVPDPNAGEEGGPPEGATIPTPPFVFGAKSQKRLGVACEIVRYYKTVGRTISAGNMKWDPILKSFKDQWDALVARKKSDDPDVPTITKELPVIRWCEAFRDYLHRVVGARTIPLAYVIREDEEVPAAVPTLANNQPYSTTYGSVEAELIGRASHDHGLYRDDNAEVYFKLEEATRSTPYADSIKPFQRTKDGRAAFLALSSQYVGEDKWEAEQEAGHPPPHPEVERTVQLHVGALHPAAPKRVRFDASLRPTRGVSTPKRAHKGRLLDRRDRVR
jgi:hypothetical protein